MIYIIKQEGLYQNKVNSSLVFTGNCKMGYYRYIYLHGWQKDFMAVKKSREFSSFVIYSYLIESAFKAGKGMKHSEARQVKGVPFVNERYTFCQNWYMNIKGHGFRTSRQSLLVQYFVNVSNAS